MQTGIRVNAYGGCKMPSYMYHSLIQPLLGFPVMPWNVPILILKGLRLACYELCGQKTEGHALAVDLNIHSEWVWKRASGLLTKSGLELRDTPVSDLQALWWKSSCKLLCFNSFWLLTIGLRIFLCMDLFQFTYTIQIWNWASGLRLNYEISGLICWEGVAI